MIKCTESGKPLTSKDTVYAVSRVGDPEAYPISENMLQKIPDDCRTTLRHRYATGGLNVHRARIEGRNGSSTLIVDRDDQEFSVPSYEFRARLPKTAERFRFPEPQAKQR